MKSKLWIVLIVTLISLTGIYWINSGGSPLKRTSEVAGREPVINYTLPPGFVFSIWGLIYLGFVIYAVYAVTRKGRENLQVKDTASLVGISIFLNLVWTVVVGADAWLWAYPLQWIMLVLSILLLFRWRTADRPLSQAQRYLSIPFALYAGWLTVAMIPFTTDLLNRSGWSGTPFTSETWAIVIYIIACLIVVLAYRRLRQPFYLLPLAWALFGFYIRFDGLVEKAAAVLGIILFIFFLIELVRFYKSPAR